MSFELRTSGGPLSWEGGRKLNSQNSKLKTTNDEGRFDAYPSILRDFEVQEVDELVAGQGSK